MKGESHAFSALAVVHRCGSCLVEFAEDHDTCPVCAANDTARSLEAEVVTMTNQLSAATERAEKAERRFQYLKAEELELWLAELQRPFSEE